MPQKHDPNWTAKDPNGTFTSDESDDDKPALDTPALSSAAPVLPANDDVIHEKSDNEPVADYTSAPSNCEALPSDEATSDESESDDEMESDASDSSISSQRTLLPATVVPLSEYGKFNKGPKKFIEHLENGSVSLNIEDTSVFITNPHSRVWSEKVFAGGIEWFLEADVVDSNGKTYLGCYLHRDTGYVGWRRFANARFSAQSGRGIELCSPTFREQLFHDGDKCGWGWQEFVEKQKLLSVYNDNDDRKYLTITVEFSVGTDIFAEANDIADVKFVVQTQAVYANRGYLMVISPVFADMFKGRCPKEDAMLEMPLTDCKLVHFLQFLAAVYPTRVPVVDQNVQGLYRMADKCKVEELVQACEDHLLVTSGISCVKKLIWADKLRRAEFCDSLIAMAAPSDLKKMARKKLRPALHSKVLEKYLATNDVPPMDKVLLVQDRGDHDLLVLLVEKLTLSDLQTIVTHEKKEQLSKEVLLKLLDHLCGLKTPHIS